PKPLSRLNRTLDKQQLVPIPDKTTGRRRRIRIIKAPARAAKRPEALAVVAIRERRSTNRTKIPGHGAGVRFHPPMLSPGPHWLNAKHVPSTTCARLSQTVQ